MLVGEGALSMINEEGCGLVLHVGKELAVALHGYLRGTSARPPLLFLPLQWK